MCPAPRHGCEGRGRPIPAGSHSVTRPRALRGDLLETVRVTEAGVSWSRWTGSGLAVPWRNPLLPGRVWEVMQSVASRRVHASKRTGWAGRWGRPFLWVETEKGGAEWL